MGIQVVRCRRFHDPAEVHDGDPVADMADDRQVVGDEQVGQLELVLEALQEVDDLGLDRHVQGADRLVGHDQLGVDRDGPGDPDPLALAAAELVRVAVQEVRVQADDVEQLGDPLAALGRRADLVDGQRLADDPAHGHPRIQAGIRVLEDHLHPPAGLAQRLATQPGDVDAVEHDLAGRRLVQPQDRPAGGRLAAARFAHQAQGLPAGQVE
jgi:hypothetical protein